MTEPIHTEHRAEVGYIPTQGNEATFRLRNTQADNWTATVPPADVLPDDLAQLANAYREALSTWIEVRDLLLNQARVIDAAKERDADLIRQRVRAGTSLADLASLTPNEDDVTRQLAEASASHVEVSKSVLRAASTFMQAVEENRQRLVDDLDADLEKLGDLASGYRRALDAISQHAANAAALRKFYDETHARNLPDYQGRPASALPSLPKRLTR